MNFKTNIPRDCFNAFTSKHNKNHFSQSYDWGVFKAQTSNWAFDTVGLEDDNGTLVAAALVLIRYLPVINRPFLYIPRGFVLDLNNRELLEIFTIEMRNYAKSKKAIFFKIDPDIKYVERDIDGNKLEGAIENDELVNGLIQMEYRHLGFSQGFASSIQPRYTFRLDLSPSEDILLKNCHSKTRYNLKVAQKKGIEIIEGQRGDLKTFEEIMRVTGARDGFLTRPLSYFENMYDTLAPSGMCKLYLAKLNTKQALDNLEQDLAQTKSIVEQYETQLASDELTDKKRKKITNKLASEQNKFNNLITQLAEIQKLYQEHPEGIVMSGIMTTHFGNKSWYLYGASDNVYREFMPNYLIQWHALTKAKADGYEIYDFFGISGKTDKSDPLYGLYRFKKGFGGEFTEFIGEFDYVINPFLYYAWTTLLPQFKKYKKRLRGQK